MKTSSTVYHSNTSMRNRYNKTSDTAVIAKGYKNLKQKVERLKAHMRMYDDLDLNWKVEELEATIASGT